MWITDRFILYVIEQAGGKISKEDLANITDLKYDALKNAESRLMFNRKIRKIHELMPGMGVRVFYELIK